MTVFIKLIDDSNSLINFFDIFSTFIYWYFNLEVVFHNKSTIIRQFYKFFVQIIHYSLHDGNCDDRSQCDKANNKTDCKVDLGNENC